jgi:hypothetical protein
MNYEILVRAKILRRRQLNIPKILSLINFAEKNVKSARSIPLLEGTSTIIFREIYESIRQLGDASWRLKGYEPSNHEIALDGLKELDIKDKVKLNYLSMFKKIRHDANYEGLSASISHVNEITNFWDSCGKEAIKIMKDYIYKLLNKINEQE